MSEPVQQDIYEEWGRDDVVPYLPFGVGRVLEVGCGRGGFGRSLRTHLGPEAYLVAIEPVASQAEIARRTGNFDEVHVGYFPTDLPESLGQFDLICFNDVLEHLVDPWQALRDCSPLLSERGRILAAIPNIQHGPTVVDLLRGNWEYTDTGILDRTHVRFFTRSSTLDLFLKSGYVPEICAGANSIFDEPESRAPSVARYLAGNFQWLHFMVLARPATEHELSAPPLPSSRPIPGRPLRLSRRKSLARRLANRVVGETRRRIARAVTGGQSPRRGTRT